MYKISYQYLLNIVNCQAMSHCGIIYNDILQTGVITMFSQEMIDIIIETTRGQTRSISMMYSALLSLSKSFDECRNAIVEKGLPNMRSHTLDTDLYDQIQKQLITINTEQSDLDNAITQLKKYCSDRVLTKTIRVKITTNDKECPICHKNNYVEMAKTNITYHIFNEDGSFKITRNSPAMQCPVCKRYFVDREIGNLLKNTPNTELEINPSYIMPKAIEYFDFVVVSNIANCTYSNHTVDDITAGIKIILPNGDITTEYIRACYCKSCDRFTILKKDYETLHGIPICKIIDNTKKPNENVTEFTFSDSDNESFFTQKGYNVNCNDDLSSAQRHSILQQIVEHKEKGIIEICSYIDALITRGKKIPSWATAVSKWKEDRDFVSNLKSTNSETVGVGSLELKYTTA